MLWNITFAKTKSTNAQAHVSANRCIFSGGVILKFENKSIFEVFFPNMRMYF
jgi:hypothetical protein